MIPRRTVGLLILAASLAAGCGASNGAASSSPATTAAAGGVEVSITNFAFAPRTVTVKAGTTVTWTNHDGVVHDVRWQSGALPASPPLSPGGGGGASWSHTFASPGTFSYICGIHPSMTGSVVVTP